jgi:hypothetical protein
METKPDISFLYSFLSSSWLPKVHAWKRATEEKGGLGWAELCLPVPEAGGSISRTQAAQISRLARLQGSR